MSEPFERVRILVLGDSGVAKTSLVSYLKDRKPPKHFSPTVGCNLELMFFKHHKLDREFVIEFIDVAGKTKHPGSRSVFYHQVNGVILVHDLFNKKSYKNLWNWASELCDNVLKFQYQEPIDSTLNRNGGNFTNQFNSAKGVAKATGTSFHSSSFKRSTSDISSEPILSISVGNPSSSLANDIPFLVVGTKLDLIDERMILNQACDISKEYKADRIDLSMLNPESYPLILNGSKNIPSYSDPFNNYLNSVIESRLKKLMRRKTSEINPFI